MTDDDRLTSIEVSVEELRRLAQVCVDLAPPAYPDDAGISVPADLLWRLGATLKIVALLNTTEMNGRFIADIKGAASEAARDEMRKLLQQPQVARPLHEWHEDFGDALWWSFVFIEVPYVGSPLDSDWPGYHTHWTPLPKVYPVTASRAFDPSSPNQDV